MISKKNHIYIFIILLSCLSCASGPINDTFEGVFGKDGLFNENNNLSTGADSLYDKKYQQPVDLAALVDPENRREIICNGTLNASPKISNLRKTFSKKNNKTSYNEVECALAAFNTYHATCSGQNKNTCIRNAFYNKKAALDKGLIIRRNQVQDEIIRVSQEICRAYKLSLNEQITKTNFALGGLATTAAGLGAIFTPASTARALSGTAGIINGVRAEYNEAYLESLTTQVVTKGIDLKRELILKEINGQRYGRPAQALNEPDDHASTNDIANKLYLASSPYTPLSLLETSGVKLTQEVENEITSIEEEVTKHQAKVTKVAAELQALINKENEETAKKVKTQKEKNNAAILEEKTEAIAQEAVENTQNLISSLTQEIERTEIKISQQQTDLEKKSSLFSAFTKSYQLAQIANKITEQEKKRDKLQTELDTAKKQLSENQDRLQKAKETTTARSSAFIQATETKSPQSKIISEKNKELKIAKTELEKATKRLDGKRQLLDKVGFRIDRIIGLVPLSQYTLERAITDAVRYHGACTIPAGLEKAIDSVRNEETPGFKALQSGLSDFIAIQTQMNQLDQLRASGDTGGASTPADTASATTDSGQ